MNLLTAIIFVELDSLNDTRYAVALSFGSLFFFLLLAFNKIYL